VEQNGTEPANRPSIAVLPFVSPDDARGEDYFADGVVDDLINNLSKIREPLRHRTQLVLRLQRPGDRTGTFSPALPA
jgi:hypothetical protein